jgi:hypothetical protein
MRVAVITLGLPVRIAQNPSSGVSDHPENHPEAKNPRKWPIEEGFRRFDEKYRRFKGLWVKKSPVPFGTREDFHW